MKTHSYRNLFSFLFTVVTLFASPQALPVGAGGILSLMGMEGCRARLATSEGPTVERLKEMILAHPVTREAYKGYPPEKRLQPEVIELLMEALEVEPKKMYRDRLLLTYFELSLMAFRVPDPEGVSMALGTLYLSGLSIKDILDASDGSRSLEVTRSLTKIHSLSSEGFEVDLLEGKFQLSNEVQQVVDHNIRSFLSREVVTGDWGFGEAINYPGAASLFSLSTRPSEYAKHAMVNIDGKAYFSMKTFDPNTNSFRERKYKVVGLSRRGNPILMIHPRSHIIVPTQTRVENVSKYMKSSSSITRVTRSQPVEVSIYRGEDGHFGQLNQLVVSDDGHHRMYQAWARRQPVHVEVVGGIEYYPFSVTWGTIKTQ